MNDIAVFYLARRAEGFSKLDAFAQSYRDYPAGVKHDLVVIAKGFEDSELDTLSTIFREVPHQIVRVDEDAGFDLHAYFIAARVVQNPVTCFLNTHTRLRADGWLLKLYTNFSRTGVGLAGASGSYESLAERRAKKWLAVRPIMIGLGAARKFLGALRQRETGGFPHFPNPHVRSNVFMMKRDVFLAMPAPEKTKESCHWFESGVHGLTATLKTKGLKSIVVGADGRAFSELDWPSSGGYRSGDQSNLLADDNVSDLFRNSSKVHRRYLMRRAWGWRAWVTKD